MDSVVEFQAAEYFVPVCIPELAEPAQEITTESNLQALEAPLRGRPRKAEVRCDLAPSRTAVDSEVQQQPSRGWKRANSLAENSECIAAAPARF